MRQLRANAVILAFALAPLIYDLCANVVTGGSLSAALSERNLWIFPFLIFSGATSFIYNFLQASDRHKLDPPDKRVENLISTVPAVEKRVKRRALAIAAGSGQSYEQPGSQHERPSPDAPPETVESLVSDLFTPTSEQKPGPSSYRAAWRLASLMGSANVRRALTAISLSEVQKGQDRLEWLLLPEKTPQPPDSSLNIVTGRIGYLLKHSGLKYAPSPPLVVDPSIAIALISVRENRVAYHSNCLAQPHEDDAEIINSLYHGKPQSDTDGSGNDEADSQLSLAQLTYRDVGKLIRPELPHLNPQMGRDQARLISHLMRHFLGDELSSFLFDALSAGNQVRLAKSMLAASQWVSPSEWRHWAATGHDATYAPELEAASDLSFAAAGGLAIGIVVMACWQIVAWISFAWNWYFGPDRFLGAWPAWGKVVLLAVAIILLIILSMQLYQMMLAVGIVTGLAVIICILVSPVVRVHSWLASWETASTVIICAIIFSPILGWLGVFYSDLRSAEEPVQLGNIARGKLSKVPHRSRYRPQHEFGHEDWCSMAE